MSAWNGWYHVNGNTYGTWLPGDPRGWRTKGHKRHVEGDYRNPPPPGTDAGLLAYSQELLKQPPVHLPGDMRKLAGQALVDMLMELEAQVLAVSVGGQHFHLLARFPIRSVKQVVGQAKRHAAFTCRDRGFQGRIWASSTKVTPVSDRSHQVNVFHYITRHEGEGAWTWTFREGRNWPTTIQRKPQTEDGNDEGVQ
jgi:REP element-mobilizing transposase RayT